MAIFRMPRKDSDLTAQSELSLRSTHMQSYRKCCGPAHNVFINCKCYSGKLMIMYYFQVVIYRETNSSESLNTIEPRYLELAYFLRSTFSSFPHYYIYIFLTSGVKLHIHLLNVVVQFIVFLTLSTLICRSTDISKCFTESLGIRDNGSRL